MKILSILCIGLLFLVHGAIGQENSPIKRFEGRGQMNSGQRILDLSYQNLNKVPISANDATIEILILDNNKLTQLPNWIGQLSNLRVLSVRNNNLQDISSALGQCTKLEQLYLSGNSSLFQLPNLSSCRNIMLIDVVNTKIQDIPVSIRTMDQLYYFKYSTP
ncbi:leucine-rich repeat domain-containing protein [Sunxiuqinia elliptica]|uniref:Leucine rich repeat (LRR) protein n=1 Tax=Sunxiuqinia elliptica TaxID=655355 RepID=A0A4R6GKY6_9BACT|nr:leucine-rich repeat domain-containing protein [Sunxiuqinia elliptica]TDN95792.1 leucine rich repeat (LRR) protein [Sunxiuqinia elliptica]TDO67734.1 leucine rich repeat (LRR) protein [Sunxiuqinia elliptica]